MVFALAGAVVPAFAGHPEVFVPVCADGGGIVSSPILESGDALGLELFP